MDSLESPGMLELSEPDAVDFKGSEVYDRASSQRHKIGRFIATRYVGHLFHSTRFRRTTASNSTI